MTLSSCHHMCFLQVDRGHIQRVELAPQYIEQFFPPAASVALNYLALSTVFID
jgi:hypothetical protein